MSTERWGEWDAYEPAANPALDVLSRYGPVDRPSMVFQNGVLSAQIEVESMRTEPYVPVLHVSFRRMDRRALHDWRMVQRMKSELLGADVEAIELYPAEERLLDGANQYHLYAMPPGIAYPFGYRSGRSVMGPDGGREWFQQAGIDMKSFKAQQRPFGQEGEDVARTAVGFVQQHRIFPEWQDWTEDAPS